MTTIKEDATLIAQTLKDEFDSYPTWSAANNRALVPDKYMSDKYYGSYSASRGQIGEYIIESSERGLMRIVDIIGANRTHTTNALVAILVKVWRKYESFLS